MSHEPSVLETNSRQLMFVLAAVAASYGLLLLFLYLQSALEVKGALSVRVHLLGFLPGFTVLGAGGVLFSMGAIQGTLHDIRAEQAAANGAVGQVLEELLQAGQQRSSEVEMLADELDQRD
jgi:hypothetical protein